MIDVDYTLQDDALKACIKLPDALQGTFHWQGEIFELHSGENIIEARKR